MSLSRLYVVLFFMNLKTNTLLINSKLMNISSENMKEVNHYINIIMNLRFALIEKNENYKNINLLLGVSVSME